MRGFWYIIESVLVSLMVISFLLFIGSFYSGNIGSENLAEKGHNILQSLDERGELRNHTVALDNGGLNELIPVYSYNHTVQICDYSGSCTGQRPNATRIWTASYIISGDDRYQPFEIRLYFFPFDVSA